MGRGVDRAVGLADAIVRGAERGDGAVEGLPTLVEQFVGGVAARDQRAGSIELLLRERHLGRLLHDVGLRLVEALLGLLDLRFGLSKRRFEIPGVHAGEHLGRFDHVAFVGEHLGDAPRELGVDIDLVRLDPAVAERDAGRQLRLRLPPDIEPAAGQARPRWPGRARPEANAGGPPSASRPAKGPASALAQAPWIALQSTGRPAPRSALRRGQCDWHLRPSRRPGWSAAMTISDSHVIAQKIVARMRLNSPCRV